MAPVAPRDRPTADLLFVVFLNRLFEMMKLIAADEVRAAQPSENVESTKEDGR
jgi:hypothetical protein